MPSPPGARERGPMSPCISVCVLGEDGRCNGCLRERDEIAAWPRMTAAEQWSLLARLEARRAEQLARRNRGPAHAGP